MRTPDLMAAWICGHEYATAYRAPWRGADAFRWLGDGWCNITYRAALAAHNAGYVEAQAAQRKLAPSNHPKRCVTCYGHLVFGRIWVGGRYCSRWCQQHENDLRDAIIHYRRDLEIEEPGRGSGKGAPYRRMHRAAWRIAHDLDLP